MPDKISRREFIKKSALGIAAGTAVLSSIDLAALAAETKHGKVIKNGNDVVVNLNDAKNSTLAKVGGSVLLDDDNMLIRISQTRFAAVNLICTHKGCTVEIEGSKFVCPCHGSEYTLEGKVTEGPSKKDLKTYEVVYDPTAETVTVKMGDKEDK